MLGGEETAEGLGVRGNASQIRQARSQRAQTAQQVALSPSSVARTPLVAVWAHRRRAAGTITVGRQLPPSMPSPSSAAPPPPPPRTATATALPPATGHPSATAAARRRRAAAATAAAPPATRHRHRATATFTILCPHHHNRHRYLYHRPHLRHRRRRDDRRHRRTADTADQSEMIIGNDKYNMSEVSNSYYSVLMRLTIRKFRKEDFGGYKGNCWRDRVLTEFQRAL
ncbi:SFRICE_014820 [Gryllus bimaculatus]|nr:SFRICE_014820 [Gryllus bimaculatus]